MSTNMLNNTSYDYGPCTYIGAAGTMESDGMLFLMKRMHTLIGGKIYYEYIVSDDDTNMKKYLTCPQK